MYTYAYVYMYINTCVCMFVDVMQCHLEHVSFIHWTGGPRLRHLAGNPEVASDPDPWVGIQKVDPPSGSIISTITVLESRIGGAAFWILPEAWGAVALQRLSNLFSGTRVSMPYLAFL